MKYYNQKIWDVAAHAYSEPGRFYHNEGHLVDVVDTFYKVEALWQHPQEVCLALIFHDVVYVAGASDNEVKSADFARKMIEHLMPGVKNVDYVSNLILLTASHGKLSSNDVSDEEALFLDCDMAILGSASEAFDIYDANIAMEYTAILPDVYREGRRRFLEGLLSKDRIFLSPYFYEQYDRLARENLRRAIERLKG